MRVLAVLAALAVVSGCASYGGPIEQEESGPPEPSEARLIVVGDDSCRLFTNEANLAVVDGSSTALADLAPFVQAFEERYPECQSEFGFVSTYLDLLRWSSEAKTYNWVLREWNKSGWMPLEDYHQAMPEPSKIKKP